MKSPYKVIAQLGCQLGEGAWWSVRDARLYWVDILGKVLHRVKPDEGAVESWPMPERIGWVIERESKPGFIAGLQSGFAELVLDPFTLRPIVNPEPHFPGNRMNDAGVDSRGRIWAGTMDASMAEARGALYCLDTNFGLSCHDEGYLVTNGPVFDDAHAVMYHSDTGIGVIYRYELSSEGQPVAKSEFLRFPESWGYPDGMTLDVDGGLWVAHFGGGCVSRFLRDGSLDRRIELPASQITNCVFGGPNLDRLFVTSAAVDRPDEPLGGAVFEVDPLGEMGYPPRLFRG